MKGGEFGSGIPFPPTLRSKPPTEYALVRAGRKAAKAMSSRPRAWAMLSSEARLVIPPHAPAEVADQPLQFQLG